MADEGDNAAVPLDGVSLAALRAFCDDCSTRSFASPAGDALRFDQLTTAQVVEKVIKRDTLETGCTYAELLLARHGASAAPDSRAPVGRANAFVSHAWSYRFVELVDALLTHFEGTEGAGDAYLWLDIFVGSQHKAPNLPSRWWTETFRGAVCAVGRTVLVLQPWNAPEPLTRSWCLWEIFCTLQDGVPLEVALSSSEAVAFQHALEHRFDDIAAALAGIDTRNARAYKETDRAMIELAVNASDGGFKAVNSRLYDCLRDWLAKQARALLAERAVTLGPDDAATLSVEMNLAGLLRKAGRLHETERMLRRVLACRTAALGLEHRDTALSQAALGAVLGNLGHHFEALPLLQSVLAYRTTALGPDHPDTISAASAVANMLRKECRLAEAEPLSRAVLSARRAALGEAHHSTLAATSSLASVLANAGGPEQLEEAEALYAAAVALRRSTLGALHPNTLRSQVNMASVLHDRGRREEAVALLRSAVSRWQETQGESHPDTLLSLNNLAIMLCADGQLDEAARVHADVLARRSASLGAEHPGTLLSLNNLAVVRAAAGDVEEAEALLRRALAAGARVVSRQQLERTLLAQANLAALLHARGCSDEADGLLEERLRMQQEHGLVDACKQRAEEHAPDGAQQTPLQLRAQRETLGEAGASAHNWGD